MDKEFALQYQQEKWYKLSGRIKARDHNTCQMCGCNDKPMKVHHLYYEPNITDVPDQALITLCEDCHEMQHQCRKEISNEIQRLRWYLTDVEIRMILREIYDHVRNNKQFKQRDLEPTKTLIGKNNWCKEYKAWVNNLAKWRKGVRIQLNKEEAIKMFASGTTPIGPEYLKEVKKWFKETYNEDIEDYI